MYFPVSQDVRHYNCARTNLKQRKLTTRSLYPYEYAITFRHQQSRGAWTIDSYVSYPHSVHTFTVNDRMPIYVALSSTTYMHTFVISVCFILCTRSSVSHCRTRTTATGDCGYVLSSSSRTWSLQDYTNEFEQDEGLNLVREVHMWSEQVGQSISGT